LGVLLKNRRRNETIRKALGVVCITDKFKKEDAGDRKKLRRICVADPSTGMD